MTEAVFDFAAIGKIANLRALDGRPQNVEPKKPEPVDCSPQVSARAARSPSSAANV
jgi:hypothetical protein